MKNLTQLIIEKKLTDKQQSLVGEYVVNLFKGSKLSKDKIKDMLKSLSKDDVQPLIEIEEYIEKTDKKNSFPYLVSKDDFLKKDNYEKIIDNFAQYIEKYIAQ
jgi:mannitol-specific phosphotransferase system IIBC component